MQEQNRPPFLSMNGHLQKPIVARGKTPARVRKAVADALARQNQSKSARYVTIKVGDEWGGAGRRATLNLPDDLLEILPDPDAGDSVIRPMPRRQQAKADADAEKSYAPPQMPIVAPPKIGLLKTWRRLVVWFGAGVAFQLGNAYDVIRGRDSEERRAVRLRQTFERIGGTFVKIGQQMASRLDLLPQRYCEELASMLDRYPPFPTEQAVAVIERSTGRKLDEIFSVFDPQPIGSASIACVYQARLKETGIKVAVKVRRPGIRELFEADFKALDFLGKLAEGLTLVRPGFTTNVRSEFRESLSSELNFRREARIGELFRRRAERANERFFTAPKVYFEFSNDEVLVQEFVSGMWMWEILAAVERNDSLGLARMRELNLDPKVIAHRLLYTHYWGIYNNVAFHADPHPANIVVRTNNELVFVDFGATGYMSKVRKLLFRRSFESFMKGDPGAMAQGGIMLSEPLPPMDINAVMRELEVAYHHHMVAIMSKHSPWYERTSASMFIATINIMSKFNVPAPQDILMFARATLLYDTMAARLDPKINFYKEHSRFGKAAAKKARKRGRKALIRRLRRGLTGAEYEVVGQMLDTGGELLFRIQRLLAVPYDFAILPFQVEKWIFTASTVLQFLLRAALITLVGMGIAAGIKAINGQAIVFDQIWQAVIIHPLYLVVVAVLLMLNIRVILFRWGDKTRQE